MSYSRHLINFMTMSKNEELLAFSGCFLYLGRDTFCLHVLLETLTIQRGHTSLSHSFQLELYDNFLRWDIYSTAL